MQAVTTSSLVIRKTKTLFISQREISNKQKDGYKIIQEKRVVNHLNISKTGH